VHHEEYDKTAYADNKWNVYHGVLLCPIFIHWNPDHKSYSEDDIYGTHDSALLEILLERIPEIM
jgi:hypothetical protein